MTECSITLKHTGIKDWWHIVLYLVYVGNKLYTRWMKFNENIKNITLFTELSNDTKSMIKCCNWQAEKYSNFFFADMKIH